MISKKSIKIVSDIHLEFYKSINPVISKLNWSDNEDILILAGDIGKPFTDTYYNFLRYASLKFKHIILVAGNHEYWSSNKTHDALKLKLVELASKFKNVYFLDDASVILDGVKYIGATLWSDISKNSYEVKEGMNDYSKIKHYLGNGKNKMKKKIIPSQTLIWHNTSVEYLKKEIKDTEIPIIIVTHHLPSFQSLKGNSKDGMSSAYATNLEFMIKSPIKLWVHGHNHQTVDYNIGSTRVVCNPLGYPDEDSGYNSKLIVDV